MTESSGQQVDRDLVADCAKLRTAVIIGAQGGIGKALLEHLGLSSRFDQLIAITRGTREIEEGSCVRWLKSNGSEQSIQRIVSELREEGIILEAVFITLGTLHDEHSGRMPEKRVDDLSQIAMEQVFSVNTFLPMLWIKGLSTLLNKQSQARFVVFSARVGSIGDNRLGGWYSYRASKAALNMMLKTLAIEFKRRFPACKIISFHPGTTDTHLSKPFQKNVPENKLFSADFVASRVVEIVKHSKADGNLSYLDWNRQDIPW